MAGRSRETRGKAHTGIGGVKARRERRRSRFGGVAGGGGRLEAAGADSAQATVGSDLTGQLHEKREAGIARVAALAMEMEREIAALGALDSVISIYDPDHVKWRPGDMGRHVAVARVAPPSISRREEDEKEPPREEFYREAGEFFGQDERTAVVKGILEKAGRSMSSGEIVDEYEARKGVVLDKGAKSVVVSRISAILARLRNQGKVTDVVTDGLKKEWRLL